MALGIRKTKTVNGDTTRYISAPIFGLPRTLLEVDIDMKITSTYVQGGGQILKEEPSVTNRNQDLYYLTDGTLGSVRYTVDMAGKVQSTTSYEAFGQRHSDQTGNLASNGHYGYTGEMTEPDSGLIYLRARYYDPELGRFISADPFLGRLSQPVTQNRYIYVHNNPLVYSDPSGLDTEGYKTTFNANIFGYGVAVDFGPVRDHMGNSAIHASLGFGKVTGKFGLSIVDARELPQHQVFLILKGQGT